MIQHRRDPSSSHRAAQPASGPAPGGAMARTPRRLWAVDDPRWPDKAARWRDKHHWPPVEPKTANLKDWQRYAAEYERYARRVAGEAEFAREAAEAIERHPAHCGQALGKRLRERVDPPDDDWADEIARTLRDIDEFLDGAETPADRRRYLAEVGPELVAQAREWVQARARPHAVV